MKQLLRLSFFLKFLLCVLLSNTYANTATNITNNTEANHSKTFQTTFFKKPKILKKIVQKYDQSLFWIDQLIVKRKAILYPYVPIIQYINLMIDYSKPIASLWKDQTSHYEGGISFIFRKNIYASLSMGYASLHPKKAYKNAVKYHVKGNYSVIGIGYAMQYDTTNFIYASIGYGISQFQDEGKFEILSKFDKTYHHTLLPRLKCKANWYEVNIGSETKLFSLINLYAGILFKFCFLAQFKNDYTIPIYTIPGYGIAESNINFAINLYLQYKIPIIKKII